MRDSYKLAVKNISGFGDTDVFPFPIDNVIFYDREKEIVDLLDNISGCKPSDLFAQYPLLCDTQLVAAGYFGFRSVTQLDPIWNAFLLGKVLFLAASIEAQRIAPDKCTIFSYRYKPDPEAGSLFDREIGWHAFQTHAVELAQQNNFVVSCDISNFYSRIYHHRLENSLQRITSDSVTIQQIFGVLTEISNGTSYGLPVGGPAARILSELLLDNIDKLLQMKGITFARFVDDYYIFAQTKAEAYRNLVFLSEKLMQNEGLSLQKAKTKIVSAKEFLTTSEFVDHPGVKGEPERVLRKFRKVRLHYDPYSLTADDDYANLKSVVAEFDIVGMLRSELRKTRIHEPTTRKLLTAIKALDPEVQIGAIQTVLDHLEKLIPVFPKATLLLKDVVRVGEAEVNEQIFSSLHRLFAENSPVIGIALNMAYALRVLAFDSSIRTDVLLNHLFEQANSPMLKRDIIYIMANKKAHPWLSDKLKHYSTATIWEQRALFMGSYLLTDEGAHWRRKVNKTPYCSLIGSWFSARKLSNTHELPI